MVELMDKTEKAIAEVIIKREREREREGCCFRALDSEREKLPA